MFDIFLRATRVIPLCSALRVEHIVFDRMVEEEVEAPGGSISDAVGEHSTVQTLHALLTNDLR